MTTQSHSRRVSESLQLSSTAVPSQDPEMGMLPSLAPGNVCVWVSEHTRLQVPMAEQDPAGSRTRTSL